MRVCLFGSVAVSLRISFLIASSLVPGTAFAQEIGYDEFDYLYAESVANRPDGAPILATDDVLGPIEVGSTLLTFTAPAERQPRRAPGPASRVIAARKAPEAITNSSAAGLNNPPRIRERPVITVSNSEKFAERGTLSAPVLPAGGELVAFDQAAWLSECRLRLKLPVKIARSGDDDARRPPASAQPSGAQYSPTDVELWENYPLSDVCEQYLKDYIASATSGSLLVATAPGQQYFLVPVTVTIPQAVTYRDVLTQE